MRLRDVRGVKSWRGKRVLVRVDFDVSVAGGRVEQKDRARIQAGLPTIEWLRKRGARLILLTHVGRPDGKRVAALSTKPIAQCLRELGVPVRYVPAAVGARVTQAAQRLKDGEVLLPENVRFDTAEEKNNAAFAKRLAAPADAFVNDAFAVCHRAYASVVGIPKFLPSYAGLELVREVAALERVLRKPKRPLVVVIGGAKIKTKFPIIKYLLRRADQVLLGGAIANTFFAARGVQVGESLVDTSLLSEARRLLHDKKLILPVDVRVLSSDRVERTPRSVLAAVRPDPSALHPRVVFGGLSAASPLGLGCSCRRASEHPFSWVGSKAVCSLLHSNSPPLSLAGVRVPSELTPTDIVVDIGPKTERLYADIIGRANTLVWNGPLGICENPAFAKGSFALARAFVRRARGAAFGLVGGGDTLPCIAGLPGLSGIDFISTGGGAMLEYLSGKKLPGLIPLLKNPKS